VRRFLLRRLIQALGVVLFVTTLSFVLMHLAPGDPVGAALEGSRVTEAVRAQWRAQLGLDRPIGEQYLRWLGNVAHGQLGYSISLQRPVRDIFADAMPRTLLLSGLAMLLSFALGISVGVLQAERPFGKRDKWLGRILLVLYSVPDFWLALIILLVFAYRMPIFPVGGVTDTFMYEYLSPARKLLDRVNHLVLPVLTLTLLASASIARYQRSALLAALPSDFMRTALAKGVPWRKAVRRHALRNALLPTITLFGLSLPGFIAGAVFVERVFSWPGLGYLTVTAIAAHDYHLVTAGVLVMSILVVIGSVLADLAVAAADPRIRLS
jgi:peptide/nickel transport system permease protein